jgi:hypothetical protein
LTETIRKDKYLQEKEKGRENLHKYWKDKNKEKYDQRRKGFKHPFNRNNHSKNQQDQSTKNESKRKDSLGKRGIPPIKCLGCKEDHMYKYFTHREDKMNTMHNIQEDTTIEYMGISIPRIYATLEDQQEHQSHMIKVEGKIINYPIAILIDSRSSRC